jgi:hypothetical protein
MEAKRSKAPKKCGSCGTTNATARCTGCKTTYYCNRGCQRAHWSAKHREICGGLIGDESIYKSADETPCTICHQPCQSKGGYYHVPSGTCSMCCGYLNNQGQMVRLRMPVYQCVRCQQYVFSIGVRLSHPSSSAPPLSYAPSRSYSLLPSYSPLTCRPQAICYPCPYGVLVTPWTWACHNACQGQTNWRVVQYGPEEVATVVLQSQYRSAVASRKALRMKLPRVELYLMRMLYQLNRLEFSPSVCQSPMDVGEGSGSGSSLCAFEGALAITIRVPTVVLRCILRFAFVPAVSANTRAPASGAGIKNEFTRSYRTHGTN